MLTVIENKKNTLFKRIICSFISFTFTFSLILPPQVSAQVIPQTVLNLPIPGSMVTQTPGFTPVLINGIQVHPDNPLKFNFYVNTGDTGIEGEALSEESNKLIKYFLAGLTVPEKEMWVNLSPYEKDRIVTKDFGDTEMGRDLLAQDYMLKQLTASMMYPENPLGHKFWERVYTKAQEKYGTTDIPMNTFNKIWIIPEEARIYEHDNGAYLISSKLKVMMEEDYLALNKNLNNEIYGTDRVVKDDAEVLSGISSKVVKEILIPEIEKEVNEGEIFANLRQIYNSIILSNWYKTNLKESLLGKIYVDKAKTDGIDTEDKQINNKIYDQYVSAFKKGVFNYIRKDYDPKEKQVIDKKYFSGGVTTMNVGKKTEIFDQTTISPKDTAIVTKRMTNAFEVEADLLESANKGLESAYKAAVGTGNDDIDVAMMATGIAQDQTPFDGEKNVPVAYFGQYAPAIDGSLTKPADYDKVSWGGKGAGLMDMANVLPKKFKDWMREVKKVDVDVARRISLNVPPGLTVSVEQTSKYYERLKFNQDNKLHPGDEGYQNPWSDELWEVIKVAKERLEETTGKKMGDKEDWPLLLAVRSGAKESMPGMMDTILNLHLDENVVNAWLKNFNKDKSEEFRKFTFDAYRRFIEMFSRTVLGLDENEKNETGFKIILDKFVEEKGKEVKELNKDRTADDQLPNIVDEYGLTSDHYIELIQLYKKELKRQGLLEKIPTQDTETMTASEASLQAAIETVMRSTFTQRAMDYRKGQGLKLEDTTSAVNVQVMVFGNRNEKSGSGVVFSRDTGTGEQKFDEEGYLIPAMEFAFNAQGEDVVSGRKKGHDFEYLWEKNPQVAQALSLIMEFLEYNYKNVQDVEITIEHDEKKNETKLWILQTRDAKRSGMAEVQTAYDMSVNEGMIDKETAVKRITPDKLTELLASRFDKEDLKKAAKEGRLLSEAGLNASPGAGVGKIVFDAEEAKKWDKKRKEILTKIDQGAKVSKEDQEFAKYGIVLVRDETSPDDLGGMVVSEAIATMKGGRTSHAAIVAKQFGIPAVVGIKDMEVDFVNETVTFTNQETGAIKTLKKGDILSVDGFGDKGKGRIYIDPIQNIPSVVLTAQNIEATSIVQDAIASILILKSQLNLDGEQGKILATEYDQRIRQYNEYIKMYADVNGDMLTEEEWNFYNRYKEWMGWANDYRIENKGLGIGANAERPLDILSSRMNGAERYGLARTEHMFSGESREIKFQKMIVANSEADRRAALDRLLPQQQSDFENIFIYADGRPVTLRLIDPPLHEFLPSDEYKIAELTAFVLSGKEWSEIENLYSKTKEIINMTEVKKKRPLTIEEKIETLRLMFSLQVDDFQEAITNVKTKIDNLKENNPMFGTRGIRLSILFPEILETQVNAILNAVERVKKLGIEVNAEIMVPLVGNEKEFIYAKNKTESIIAKRGTISRDDIKIGTMIEIGAAVPNIKAIAKEAQFLSFGTNDFTQVILKISRDDAAEYLAAALSSGVYKDDPFVTIEEFAVAKYVQRVVEEAYAVNPSISIGICGEQGADVKSIKEYLYAFGLKYISGSPRRLPTALAAASQVTLKDKKVVAPIKKVSIEAKETAKKPVNIETIEMIQQAKTIADQLKAAVNYVQSQHFSQKAKEVAIANLDLTNLENQDFGDEETLKTVLTWANDIKTLEIGATVSADKESALRLAILEGRGIFSFESILLNNPKIRLMVQEYLVRAAIEYHEEAQLGAYKANEARKIKLAQGVRNAIVDQFSEIFADFEMYKLDHYLRARLPNLSLASFFKYEDETEYDQVVKNLSDLMGIDTNTVTNSINKYHELNPAIGQKGSRIFFTKAASLYIAFSQAIVQSAQENGFLSVDIILPFINNQKEIQIIRKGFKQDGFVIPSLDEAIKEVKKDVHIEFSSDIESLSAVIESGKITEEVGSIVIPAKQLMEDAYAAFEEDVRAGFLDKYLQEGIFESDPYTTIRADVKQFILEAIAFAKEQNKNSRISLVLNAKDTELITLAQQAGVDTIILENAKNIRAATLIAAQVAIRNPAENFKISITEDTAMAVKSESQNIKQALENAEDFAIVTKNDLTETQINEIEDQSAKIRAYTAAQLAKTREAYAPVLDAIKVAMNNGAKIILDSPTVIKSINDQPLPVIEHNGYLQRLGRQNQLVVAEKNTDDVGTVIGVSNRVGPQLVPLTIILDKQIQDKEAFQNNIAREFARRGINFRQIDATSRLREDDKLVVDTDSFKYIPLSEGRMLLGLYLWYDAGAEHVLPDEILRDVQLPEIHGSLRQASNFKRPSLKRAMRIFINGSNGRIGSIDFAKILRFTDPNDIQLVAVNGTTPERLVETLYTDSVHGATLLPGDEIRTGYDEKMDIFNKVDSKIGNYVEIKLKGWDKFHRIYTFNERRQTKELPVNRLRAINKALSIDIAIDATGQFKQRSQLEAYTKAGMKKVVFTAPTKDKADPTNIAHPILIGVNDELIPIYVDIFDIASCTTNSIAAMYKAAMKGEAQIKFESELVKLFMEQSAKSMDELIKSLKSQADYGTIGISALMKELIKAEKAGIIKGGEKLAQLKKDASGIEAQEWVVEAGSLMSAHSSTSSNKAVDTSDRKARGLSAYLNIILTSTGAANAVAVDRVLPELNGKFIAYAVRIPLANASLGESKLVVTLPQGSKELTPEIFNDRLRAAAQTEQMKGTFAVEEGIPSVAQIQGRSEGGIVFAQGTQVQRIGESDTYLVTILDWYDNEWGYAGRPVDALYKIGEKIIEEEKAVEEAQNTYRVPIFGGNIKQQFMSQQEVSNLISEYAEQYASRGIDITKVQMFLGFQDLYLPWAVNAVKKLEKEGKLPKGFINIAAQDVRMVEGPGEYTAFEAAAQQLKAAGVTHVIIGHSETREYKKLTDADINARRKAIKAAGLIPVVCCGESADERANEEHFNVIGRQIMGAYDGATAEDVEGDVIAYEPIWAIGAKALRQASNEEAEEMLKYIRTILVRLFGVKAAGQLRLLYGGSVKPNTAAGLIALPNLDGGLVGGAAKQGKSGFAIAKQFSYMEHPDISPVGIEDLPEAIKELTVEQIKGKRVLVPVNLNVSIKGDGNVSDQTRMKLTEDIVNFITGLGGNIVLLAHNGRYDPTTGEDTRKSLAPVAKILEQYFPQLNVVFHEDSINNKVGVNITPADLRATENELAKQNDKRVVHVLEAVRWAPDFENAKKGSDNRIDFGNSLARLGDGILVVDRFGDIGSSGALAEDLPIRVAEQGGKVYVGPAMAQEYNEALDILSGGFKAIVFGGAKPEKVDFLENLAMRALTKDGFGLMGSGPSVALNNEMKNILEDIRLGNPDRILTVNNYRSADNTLDIGDADLTRYIAKLDTLQSGDKVLVNGTMGKVEEPGYEIGTQKIFLKLKQLAEEKGVVVIVVGGDASKNARKYGLDKVATVRIFSGGGVVIKILSGEPLVGIKAIRDAIKISDQALSTKTSPEHGGINLDPALLNLKIKRDANFVPIQMNPIELENINIEGFIPVIINITPVTNLPLLLGFADTTEDKKQRADADGYDPYDLKAKHEVEPMVVESAS